jgi:hypothetical protein
VKAKENGRTKYYFNNAYPAVGRWSAPKVSISMDESSEQVLFSVLAVTFTDATSQDISSGRYRKGVSELFANAATQDQIRVELGADRRPC